MGLGVNEYGYLLREIQGCNTVVLEMFPVRSYLRLLARTFAAAYEWRYIVLYCNSRNLKLDLL
jgi:hypothetical protein